MAKAIVKSLVKSLVKGLLFGPSIKLAYKRKETIPDKAGAVSNLRLFMQFSITRRVSIERQFPVALGFFCRAHKTLSHR